jgi:lipoate-protein ligase B
MRFNLGETLLDTRRTSANYYDALLGLRYRFDFAERWSLLTRGDFSFGDSEGIWLLQANLAYTVGKRRQKRIMVGYQYKQADYKDGDLKTDYTYHGPMAGFNFRF